MMSAECRALDTMDAVEEEIAWLELERDIRELKRKADDERAALKRGDSP